MKLNRLNKIIIAIILLFSIQLLWGKMYYFNVEKACSHLTTNALSRSHNCCAWYVMRAMQSGGVPSIILPAHMYKYYLPLLNWKEIPVKNYVPQKGDVVVFPRVNNHIWGHIAMWNGSQWVSDFKQRNIIVSKDYSTYKIFRNQDCF